MASLKLRRKKKVNLKDKLCQEGTIETWKEKATVRKNL